MFCIDSLAYQEVQMTCSHCKKSMMKGQTAYQKKGFTDVFCSKNCLFEMFPVNKPVTKTCHHCHKWVCEKHHFILNYYDAVLIRSSLCSTKACCSSLHFLMCFSELVSSYFIMVWKSTVRGLKLACYQIHRSKRSKLLFKCLCVRKR